MRSQIEQTLRQISTLFNEASARLRVFTDERRRIEERRRRLLNQLEDPSDATPDLHRLIHTLDKELDAARSAEDDFRRNAQREIDGLRRDLQNAINENLTRTEADLRQAHDEASHLREVLIPEARRYLEELESQHRQAESRRMNLLNQLAALKSQNPEIQPFDLMH